MAKKTLDPGAAALAEYEAAFGNSEFVDGTGVMRAIMEKHGVVPQYVGIDGFDDKGAPKPATENSLIVWNATGITQGVYSAADPTTPIMLMPGDCVVGLEFAKYLDRKGGVLTATRPEDSAISVRSKRDGAYFEIRGAMQGPVAERVRKFTIERPSKLPGLTRAAG